MIVTKTPVGKKFEYRVNGEVTVKASSVDYQFAALTTIDGTEIVTLHKTRPAAAKGASSNIWAARLGTVAGRNTASYKGNGDRPAPVITIKIVEIAGTDEVFA